MGSRNADGRLALDRVCPSHWPAHDQVLPGERLSLQMHHHRSEHWVVVRGIADVEIDDKKIKLYENQSTFIPLGTKHRLSNYGDIKLQIIEIQTGSYISEDDIERLNYYEDKNS